MQERIDALGLLLNFDKPIEEINNLLAKFNWDSDEYIALEPAHVRSVLNRYISDTLTQSEVEAWANAIECRDDIEFSKNHEGILKGIIYELANPYLTEVLTFDKAAILLGKLPQ